MEKDKCTHPEKSIQMLEGRMCTQCGCVYMLFRCMRCNMWFSQCVDANKTGGMCNGGERIPWE